MARSSTSGGETGGSGSGGSGSLPDSGRASKGSGGSAGSNEKEKLGAGRNAGRTHLCTFRVGDQRYALSTALVRELVEVVTITAVPRTNPAIIGLFNLRGEPMPLVDLAQVLGMPAAAPTPKFHVIILRSEHLSVGARIDQIGSVVPNTGVVAADSGPMVIGFLPGVNKEEPVAVIDQGEFLRRLDDLRVARMERRS